MPSWNGDLRLEPDPANDQRTLLWIEKPTDHELAVLRQISEVLLKAGHMHEPITVNWRTKFKKKQCVTIDAPIGTIGPLVAKLFKPGNAVLTAITFRDGQVMTATGTGSELVELARELATTDEPKPPAKKPKAVATVRRPTPSCPQCIPGSIDPAREVLLEFLNANEHELWATTRTLIVTGGLSGHRYLIAHRNTPCAAHIGRIAFDLDAQCVVHFHDRSVPPEEEVLAAKLILEHREPWLRNEATMLGVDAHVLVFKNPFGGFNDGVPDADLTYRIGQAVLQELSQ